MSEIIIEDGCSIIRVNLSCDGKFPLMIGDPNRDFVFPHYLFFGEVTGKPDVVPSIDITMHSYVRTDILSKELQQLNSQ